MSKSLLYRAGSSIARGRSRVSVITAAVAAAGTLGAAGFAVGTASWSKASHSSVSGQLNRSDFLFRADTSAEAAGPVAGPRLNVIHSDPAGGTGAAHTLAGRHPGQQVTAADVKQHAAKRQQPAKAHPAKRQAAKPKHPAKRRHPATSAKPYLIYDSVSPGAIPAGHNAAVYANGAYTASRAQMARGKHKSVLWIDVFGSDPSANVLDVEPGDATPAGAARWVKRRLSSRPHAVAIIYTMRSEWQQVKDNVATLPRWMRPKVRYWIADPTGVPHVVPGANATQWYWGKNYDITTANPGFRH